jgi:response regulator RpfG family c-di-GMP phosphodiesterase
MIEKILFVDDDPDILASYRRVLRKQFRIDTAPGGLEALELVAAEGPYAVIVSDMRMPGMDGTRFLAETHKRAPATVRMMLTGQSELDTAVEAVNEGHIFRFLTKPCPPDTLARALDAGVEQYRLITAEKDLLQKTLSGSIKLLTDVLSVVNPAAFGRASRVRRLVRQLATELKLESDWQLEVAAMLSQIGCVTLPADTLERVCHGKPLSAAEARLFQDHPKVGHDFIVNIPRLEGVAAIIRYQEKRFDGGGQPPDGVGGEALPAGARLLKVALDFDTLVTAGMTGGSAFAQLRARAGWYDPAILEALGKVLRGEAQYELRVVPVHELTTGMVLAEDVRSDAGLLLITKGQEVTASLGMRLRNIAESGGLRAAIRVLARPEVPR